jgi:hypothetical protein
MRKDIRRMKDAARGNGFDLQQRDLRGSEDLSILTYIAFKTIKRLRNYKYQSQRAKSRWERIPLL